MKKNQRDTALGILSAAGIFLIVGRVYGNIFTSLVMSGVITLISIETMKLSFLLSDVPSIIIGIIVWKKINNF